MTAFAQIAAGLADAIAFAGADTSRGRVVYPCAPFTVPPPPMRGRITAVVWPPAPPPPELPEGLWERAGRLFYTCLACERATELHCEPEEFDPDQAYCGGSPRCLP